MQGITKSKPRRIQLLFDIRCVFTVSKAKAHTNMCIERKRERATHPLCVAHSFSNLIFVLLIFIYRTIQYRYTLNQSCFDISFFLTLVPTSQSVYLSVYVCIIALSCFLRVSILLPLLPMVIDLITTCSIT